MLKYFFSFFNKHILNTTQVLITYISFIQLNKYGEENLAYRLESENGYVYETNQNEDLCKFESVEKIKDECRIEQEKCIGKKERCHFELIESRYD